MKNTQLNSGRISDFIPIGQDGQPIYLNAEAFRAALAINPMVGEERVKCLAIPRMRADGQNIDWYVSFPPQGVDGQYHVVTWANATPAERQAALARLRDFEQCLKRLGQELSRRSGDHKSRLFARYLTGQNSVQNLPAIHFPSHEYVYIVDGIPVITFWGFCSKGDRLDQSPFYSLTQPIPQPAASFAQSAEPAPAAAPYTAAAAPAAAAATTTETRHHCILPTWLLWLLGGLLLLLLLLWLLWWLLPRFGFFGGATSVFDGSYDPPAVEAPVDPTNNVAPVEQLAPASDEISHDQGVLLETVPDDVTAVQDATSPEEVQALLEAPVISKDSQTTTRTRDVVVMIPNGEEGVGSGSATGIDMGMSPDPAADPAAGLDPNTGTAPALGLGSGTDSGMGTGTGTGTGTAATLAYAEAQRSSKTPEKFGTGYINGIAAPEASNNGVTAAALIPTLTLGIPGDTSTAVLLGALAMQGIAAGPQVFQKQGVLMYTIMFVCFVINIFMYLQGTLFIKAFINVVKIPAALLNAVIIAMCTIGAFSVNNSIFDVFVMIVFAIIGYIMNKINMPTIPMLMGVILGQMAESNLRRVLSMNEGNWFALFLKPVSCVILIVSLLLILIPFVRLVIGLKKERNG